MIHGVEKVEHQHDAAGLRCSFVMVCEIIGFFTIYVDMSSKVVLVSSCRVTAEGCPDNVPEILHVPAPGCMSGSQDRPGVTFVNGGGSKPIVSERTVVPTRYIP